MPKVELHVHLEGSMSPETVGLLAQRHLVDTTAIWPQGLPERFSFDGFPDFARQFQFGLKLLRGGEDLETIVVALAAQLASNNVRYAEVTTTAYTHLTNGMSADDYGQALSRGRAYAAEKHGVDLSWVIDIPRDLETGDENVTIDYLSSPHTPDGLVAIGLGGYEVGFPAEPYEASFSRARALGLHSVPHAGETEGAQSIAASLDTLGAERIGHGVRCLEDPELVARLRDSNTMLEVCPTSNLLLHVVDSLESHPLRALIDAGLRVSVNTDDPGMFATDLTTELTIAHELHAMSATDLLNMQLDTLDASFAGSKTRLAITTQMAAFRAEYLASN
jgi:aminodeoxyfutalosine deaminase